MKATSEVEALMKRCQTGVGGRDALDQAHNLLAECYGALGALVQERDELRKSLIEAGKWVPAPDPNCNCNECVEDAKLVAAIDAAIGSVGQ